MSDINWADAMKGLGSATQSGGGSYFGPGEYLAEVVSISRKISSDPKKKSAPMIIAELRVVEVLVGRAGTATHPPSNGVGEVCAVIVNLAGAYPSLELGKLKGVLQAILGAEAATTDEEWIALAVAMTEPPGQKLAGQRLVVRGTPKATPTRSGVYITTLTFAPAPVSE